MNVTRETAKRAANIAYGTGIPAIKLKGQTEINNTNPHANPCYFPVPNAPGWPVLRLLPLMKVKHTRKLIFSCMNEIM